MKFIVIIACCLLFVTGLHAQEIIIKYIKETYSLKDKMPFTISNVSDSCIEYSIGLERLEKDGWEEITDDIFNYTNAKRIRLFSVRTGKAVSHTISPAKLLGMRAKGRQFRLKVVFDYCNRDSFVNSIQSIPFELLN